ncbi:hypothetical protein ACFVUH_05375 [Kitasatospora sp. NPDC058032]|uniref:hypothetical protein n=1 Tax=Kitasatospora sp. NPDC058032 TaxID=3346307 RepID=UPI0036D8DB40
MRTRITTLALSGLTSAALVCGAASAAYASPSADHRAAAESAEAQGEWVDGLLRQAAEDSGDTIHARTFGNRDSRPAKLVVRQFDRTDGVTETVAVDPAEAAPADVVPAEVAPAGGQAPAVAAEQGVVAREGDEGDEQGVAAQPAEEGTDQGAEEQPGEDERGLPGVRPSRPGFLDGLKGHSSAPTGKHCHHEKPACPCHHEHGGHEEHGEHGGHEEHGDHQGQSETQGQGQSESQGQNQSESQNQAQGQSQNGQQSQDSQINVTVVVQNHIHNDVNNSANTSVASHVNNSSNSSANNSLNNSAQNTANNSNSNSQSQNQTASQSNTVSNVNKSKFVEVEHPTPKPPHHGQEHNWHHGELAETGSGSSPALAGLSAAFLVAGAAAMRIGRRSTRSTRSA